MFFKRFAILAFTVTSALAAQGTNGHQFLFAGDKAAEGWGKTKTTTVETTAESLKFTGNGWDSKLYRTITLAKGNYMISGRAKGSAILQIKKSWDAKDKNLVNLNLTRDDWRTDWRQFETEGGSFLLVIYFGAAEAIKGEIQWIKIEQAPVVPDTDVPDLAALAKNRPTPEIVRGAVIGSFTNVQDWIDLKNTGANVARYVLNPVRKMKTSGAKTVFEAWPLVMDDFETRAKLARQVGIKLVPVLGDNPLGTNARLNQTEFWDHPDLVPTMTRLWKEFAERFTSYRDVIWAYDLFNEPLDWGQMPYAPRQWRTVAAAIVKAIRSVDKDVWLIYETGPGGMSWGFDGLKPLPDTRIIYGGHFYSPHEFTHQGVGNIAGTDLGEAMKKINVRYPGDVNGRVWDKGEMEKDLATTVAFQKKYRVPIYFGEFSVIKWAPKEDAVKYLADVIAIFEANGWSWCYHAFREWPGWSFEHDESFWIQKGPAPERTGNETERAKVVKEVMKKNNMGLKQSSGAADMPDPGKDAAASGKVSVTAAWSTNDDAMWKKRVRDAGGVAPSVQQTVSNEKTRISADPLKAYSSKTKLKEMKHLAPWSLEVASLKIRKDDKEYTVGTDVLLDPVWGGLALAQGSALGPKDEVELSYRLSSRRLDALVRDSNGRERIRSGTPSLITPPLPVIETGDTLLARVFVDYNSDGSAFQVLPILDASPKVPATTGPERIPNVAKKLMAGEPVKIVCWGDSVTEGGDLGPGERYGEQLAANLKKKFPSVVVDVIAVGGSHSAQWLDDIPPAQAHSRKDDTRFKRVLDAKPDLVVIEFVNDQWRSKADTFPHYRTKLIAPLRAIGAEVLLLTPQRNWDYKNSFRDPDTREYVAALREMGRTDEGVGVADMAGRWENLWREGIPFPALLANGYNHPDVRGHRLFMEEILRALGVEAP
ncbi:MAG: cellulase family glycosylhydrolase [Spirochaetia bacterium]|nr:cellulase family glycosylhydrolase [Spirochaetia bacterium]